VETRRPFRFVADQSLGKLVKWLRILGFDADMRHFGKNDMPNESLLDARVFLTRITRMRGLPRSVFIVSDAPMLQLRQVVGQTGITEADFRPLTRCIKCNRLLVPVERAAVFHRVPDYVWNRHRRFHRCPSCDRIFWQGSHPRRVSDRIRAILSRED